jgi:hypothetical protein
MESGVYFIWTLLGSWVATHFPLYQEGSFFACQDTMQQP